MSAPNIQGMQTAMVTEQLQGSQLRETVEYQVTGDAETTLLSGLLAVCSKASNNLQNGSLNPGDIARVLEYLKRRFDDAEKQRQQMMTLGQMGSPYTTSDMPKNFGGHFPMQSYGPDAEVEPCPPPGYFTAGNSATNSKTQELIDRLKLSCFKSSDDGK